MTTFGTACDKNILKITTFPFQCIALGTTLCLAIVDVLYGPTIELLRFVY